MAAILTRTAAALSAVLHMAGKQAKQEKRQAGGAAIIRRRPLRLSPNYAAADFAEILRDCMKEGGGKE